MACSSTSMTTAMRRTTEWLEVVDGLWTRGAVQLRGRALPARGRDLRAQAGRSAPIIYAGGESEAAKTMIATQCDAYVMHGDPRRGDRAQDRRHEARAASAAGGPPMQFGMAAYAIVRDSEAEAKRELERITTLSAEPPRASPISTSGCRAPQLERELKLQEYSVSNRGLRPNLVGTPEQLRERIAEYEAAGLDLLLLQMSPQAEEMERFAAQVMGTA